MSEALRMLAHARRLRSAVELLLALKSARSADGRTDRAKLIRVQRVLESSGGLASPVAEIMASYTGVPPYRTGAQTLAGRELLSTNSDAMPIAHDVEYEGLDLDRTLLRAATRLATRRRDRARLAASCGEHLAKDLETQRRLGTCHTQQVAAELQMHVPDLAGSVQVGCGGALVTTTEIDPLSLATSVVQMVVGHGLVHARIGIAGQWEDEMLHISHWETSRVVSRRVSCTIRSVLQLDGQVTKEMSEQMEAMGIDHNLSLDLLPMLTGSLERLVDAEPKLPDLLCPRPAQLPTVPDDLGLVYATACLMGTATLLGDMGTNADWTYGSSDGFSAANP